MVTTPMRAQAFQQSFGMLFTLLIIGLLFFAAAKGYGMLMHTAQKQQEQRFTEKLGMLDAYTSRGSVLHTTLTLPDGSQGFCIFNLKAEDKTCNQNGLGDTRLCNTLKAYWNAAGEEEENVITPRGLRASAKKAYFGTIPASWQNDPLLAKELKDTLKHKQQIDWYCYAGPHLRISVHGVGTGYILLAENT